MKTFRIPSLVIAVVGGPIAAIGLFVIFTEDSTVPPAEKNPAAASAEAPSKKSGTPLRNPAEWDTRIAAAETPGLSSLARMALQIPDEESRSQVMAKLVTAWIDRDIASFIEFIDEMEVDDVGDGAAWEALAPALMVSLPNVGEQAASSLLMRQLIERLIVNFAPSNPSQALEWAQTWLYDRELQAAMANIAPEMARISPDEGLQLAKSISNAGRRMEAFAGVGSALGETNPEVGLRMAKELPNTAESAFMMGSVLDAMAEAKPVDAAGEFESYRARLESNFKAQVERERAELGTTAEDDFEGMDPEYARNMVPVSPNLRYIDDAAIAIAKSWAKTNLQDAMQWARNLPADRVRIDALAAVYETWAEASPAEAFAAYLSNSTGNSEISSSILGAWAETSPSGAAAALPQLPTGERAKAVEAVTVGWLESGPAPETVQAWVDTLPEPSERDLATDIIVSTTAFDHPEFAWQQALRIQNPKKRESALQRAFENLAASDPKAARLALGRVQLSPEQSEDFAILLESAENY